MQVLIDVGNTNVCIGICENNTITKTYRLITELNKTADEYYVLIHNMVDIRQVEKVYIASVVPAITTLLIELFKKYYNIVPLTLQPGTKTGILLKTDNPKEVGADIICDAVGSKKYGDEVLVIDLGTAIKYIYVQNNILKGVIISPGVVISMNALVKNTALLPEIDIKVPKNVLGKNTFDCMASGVTYGVAAQVDGLIERIKKEVNNPNLVVVATGGLAELIVPICKDEIQIDHNLTLMGLKEIGDKNILNN